MDLLKATQCNLFASLREAELEDILSKINITESHFKKGTILTMQNEPCNRLIILLKGSVKAEMSDPSGKIIKVEEIHAPNPLAILFLFGENNRFPVQTTALENIKALVIPKPSVLRMLQMNETILKNYLDISANFANRLSSRLHFMSFRNIRQKMSMYLLDLSKRQQTDTITLDKPKSVIAEYFAVSRPSLERELSKMQQDGLIVSNKKQITLLEKNKLIQLISF